MKRQLITLVLASVLVALAAPVTLAAPLPRSTPAAEGISSQAILDMVDSLQSLEKTWIHHLMVIRHGRVVAEVHPTPFRASDTHTLYSASKTFTAMAIGLCVDDNRLRMDDRVAAFFPDKLPDTVSANLATVTVRDVITMMAGAKPDWVLRNVETDWLRALMAKPIERPTTYQYDTMCSFILAAIVQRVSGKTALQLLNERLFGYMEITDAQWQQSPDGYNTGGWGLRVSAEDCAKLAVLIMNKGRWQGQQLISEAWIDEMCARQVASAPADTPLNDGSAGYGYHIWRCKYPGAVRADGAYGQYIVMVPERDVAVVLLGVSYNGHGELACIWDRLMPGVHDTPLTADHAASRLQRALAQWSQPMPQGQRAASHSDINRHELLLDKNKHGLAGITVSDNTLRLRYVEGQTETLELGNNRWAYTPLAGYPLYSIHALNRFEGLTHDFEAACTGAWTSSTTLQLDVCYVNWISATRLVVDTAAGTVTITDNVEVNNPQTVTYQLAQ